MKRLLTLVCAIASLAAIGAAQPSAEPTWVGVWQGYLDKQPGVTVTLANDSGALGGTIVLNIVVRKGDTVHVVASEPHVLLNPQLSGNVLTFHVRQIKDHSDREFTMTLSDGDTAQLQCTNCGGSPRVEVKRTR